MNHEPCMQFPPETEVLINSKKKKKLIIIIKKKKIVILLLLPRPRSQGLCRPATVTSAWWPPTSRAEVGASLWRRCPASGCRWSPPCRTHTPEQTRGSYTVEINEFKVFRSFSRRFHGRIQAISSDKERKNYCMMDPLVES